MEAGDSGTKYLECYGGGGGNLSSKNSIFSKNTLHKNRRNKDILRKIRTRIYY